MSIRIQVGDPFLTSGSWTDNATLVLTSDLPGVACAAPAGERLVECDFSVPDGAVITFTAALNNWATLRAWGIPGCSASTFTCVVTMDHDMDNNQADNRMKVYADPSLVSVGGECQNLVESDQCGTIKFVAPPGLADYGIRGGDCRHCGRNYEVPVATTVTMRAVAEPGWVLDRWINPACGSAPQCSMVVTGTTDARAVFRRI